MDTVPSSPSDKESDEPSLHASAEGGDLPDLEPITFSFLGRFFAVPMGIIGVIVGGAVLVVFLFGGPAAPKERSVDTLLQALEASSGEKSFGVLLPREKELWQTALELTLRLEGKGLAGSLTDEELASVADRLRTMVLSDLESVDRIATVDSGRRSSQRAARSRRLEFLIRALGRTEQPSAIETLIEIVRRGEEPFVQVAMHMLGDLHERPAALAGTQPILHLLLTSSVVETRMIAATALSVLAREDNKAVIEGLKRARLSAEGELAWSCGLALARLGSAAGKSAVLDLMDRSFLESGRRYRVVDEKGVVQRYPLPPQRVEALMLAAMDAALNLEDRDLWDTIAELQSDSSPVIRAKAIEAVKNRKAPV